MIPSSSRPKPNLRGVAQTYDEIGEHNSVMIDKPIELVPIRRRMDTRGAAVLNPIDKLLERHFVSELPHFLALIKRKRCGPRGCERTRT